jgi:hypothetical protein
MTITLPEAPIDVARSEQYRKLNPVEWARAVFDGDLPPPIPALHQLQMELAAWQGRKFGAQLDVDMVLGINEEGGELLDAILAAVGVGVESGKLSHAMLKHRQKIRGLQDTNAFRAAAGDAVGDNFVYSVQFCTILRLDYGALILGTSQYVMRRKNEGQLPEGK